MNIEEVFDQYVTALETNDMDLLDDTLCEDVVVSSSNLGEIRGLNTVKMKFSWQGMPLDFSKIRVFNNVIRSDGNKAYQSVFLVMIFGKEINSFMNIFQCAFLNTLEYTKGLYGFKIAKINCNMTFECGNTLLVSGWWNLINYSTFDGNDFAIIDSHKNSPWEQVPNTEVPLNDEEKIKQCFYHYNWLIDTNNFGDLSNITTENVYYSKAGQVCRADWMYFLEEKRSRKVIYNNVEMYKEACWNHISTFKSLEINGSTATADIYRFEPNRIGTKFIHKYNINTIYYSATWHITFVKDKNDEWKMDIFDADISQVENNNDTDRRYF